MNENSKEIFTNNTTVEEYLCGAYSTSNTVIAFYKELFASNEENAPKVETNHPFNGYTLIVQHVQPSIPSGISGLFYNFYRNGEIQ